MLLQGNVAGEFADVVGVDVENDAGGSLVGSSIGGVSKRAV